jgi:hypothetical protein
MLLWQMIVCGARSEVGSLSLSSTSPLNVMMASRERAQSAS